MWVSRILVFFIRPDTHIYCGQCTHMPKLFVHYEVYRKSYIHLCSLFCFINFLFRYHLLFVFFVSILFCLSISSLFGYHIWLVLHNRTTLEQFRAPMFENNLSDPNGWSLGKINNLREVFGELIFLYPIYNAYLSMVSLNKIDEFQLYNIHKNSLS